MRLMTVKRLVKETAWHHLQLGMEYSALHAWASQHGHSEKAERFLRYMHNHYDAFHMLTSEDEELRLHLRVCLARYRHLLRAAAKMRSGVL